MKRGRRIVDFYSARLSFIVFVDGGRAQKKNTWDDMIVVFRAKDPEHAFERALEIGKSREAEYLNHKKQKVRWALVSIENVDCVGKRVDGAEVASRLSQRRSKKPIGFNTRFRPEDSAPSGSF